jgi:hypothetical protein
MSVNQDPTLVVTRASSGIDAFERYQSGRRGGAFLAGEPLVPVLRAEMAGARCSSSCA